MSNPWLGVQDMVTATAQVVGHVASMAIGGNHGFSEIVFTAQWWADNIGQILGAALGAGVSFIGGFWVARREDRIADKKAEEDRLMHLGFFYEDTAELRKELKTYLRETAV